MDFLDFLNAYKEVLIGSFCVLLTLLSILLKRKPKTIDDFLLCLDEVGLAVPKLVSSVECSGEGFRKKTAVISSAEKILSKKLGRNLSSTEKEYFNTFISNCIEEVLTAPQKKGV